MKFSSGDFLSLKIADDLFLGGLVSLTERDKYEIGICNYRRASPPSEPYFNNCELFATKYEMGETNMSLLDVIVIDSVYADHSADIETICHIKLPGFIAASGFFEIVKLEDLVNYFELEQKLRDGNTKKKADPYIPEFEIKHFIDIKDLVKSIPPANEFPTIKLYKKDDRLIHYWQMYGNSSDSLFLIVHWGILGETGEFFEIKDKLLAELKKIYEDEIAARQDQGYAPPIALQNMILQFKTNDEWGATDDLDFRNDMWELLDRYFFWTGNGSISGGDIGSGTLNLFFEAISADIAINMIVQVLQENKINREFRIAIEDNDQVEKTGNNQYGIKVLYPQNHEVPFFY